MSFDLKQDLKQDLITNDKLKKEGDIKSLWKRKVKYQRGLSLTTTVLKCFEKIIAKRINSTCKEMST